MKKILLIHTGGTLGMLPVEPLKTLAPADIHDRIVAYLPEAESIAKIDFEIPFNIDSANIQIHHWQRLAEIIHEKYPSYDGFVIIHGTDAMVYTAAALSYMLRRLDKPIILTGSQRPLAQIRGDARSNLINSLELATYPIAEVSIFFGKRLYRGNRTIKLSSTHYDAFDSPNFPSLAEVGLDITVADNLLPKGDSLVFEENFDNRVFCFNFHPDMTPGLLDFLIDSPIQAVVVRALGSGNLAVSEKSVIPWIEKMNRADKLVVISSQSPYGRVNLDLYECGKMALDAGAVSAGDMTTPAAIVKLMFLLDKHPGKTAKIKEKFSRSLAGEISSAKGILSKNEQPKEEL